MSQIHVADGQTDSILDYITANNIISDTHKKSLENTLETYNFITFADKSFSEFLEKRNRVIIPDEDDSLVEFVIFEAHKYRDTEGHKAQVYAHASYLELKKASVIYPNTFTGTASQHGGRALNDTGWEIGIVESDRVITIEIENHTNPYEYLKRIARELELELDFRVEHNGTKITRRIVNLVERIGAWRGREAAFGKDLDGIRRVEKQDIVTALLGLGPEDENGNRLEVLVEDEEALQRWGRRDEYGNLQHLIEHYEIQSDRSEMTESEARQYTRTALDKRINTQVTYETTIVDLENVPGMANKKIRFGDTIKIKDEKFNPPLYLEARVFELERSVKSNGKKEIKLGDFIEYTEEQVHDIFNQLRKEIRARITRSEMVEHTYSKIEIDNKDQYIFDEGKTFAEAVGIQAEDNAKAYAVEQDSALKTDVKDYADQVADQAKDEAKIYADDVSAQALQQALAESVSQEAYDDKMQEIALDLADKADIEYIDGQLIDKVNVGDVYTIDETDNMLLNYVGYTEYQTDVDGIVTELESQSTRLGQNEEAIGLQADRIDMVEGTVSDHSAELLTMADEISARVTADYVQTAIGDIEIGGRNLYGDFINLSSSGVNNLLRNTIEAPKGFQVTGTSGNNGYVQLDGVIQEPGTYTLSWEMRGTQSVAVGLNIGTPNGLTKRFATNNTNTFQKYIYTFKIDDFDEELNWLRFSNIQFAYFRIKNIKLEKGNKATDWTPAPEDVEAEISSLSAELSVQAGKINAKADSTVVDGLGTRITTAEQTIDSLEGEISSKVSMTDFNALDGTVSDLQSTVTQTAQDVQFAFDEIDDMGNAINNATVTISGDGVTVTDGDFNLRDSRSNMLYSASPKRNLLKDHSFELLPADGSSINQDSINYNWLEMLPNRIYEETKWWRVGNPKVAVQLAPDSNNALPIFGSQAVVVRNANYIRQYVYEGVGAGSTYTISGSFKRQWRWNGQGIPRFEVWHIDALGNRLTRIVNATFSAVSSDYSVTRHSATFNVPSSFVETDQLEIIVSGGNNHWIQCDGVQLVEGDRASIYLPEDLIWEVAKGQIQPLNQQRILWVGQVYPTETQTVVPDKELDRCVNGWVLKWQRYIPGTGWESSNYQYSFIPKNQARYGQGGRGVRFLVGHGTTTVYKYIYVYNDKIVGHATNGNSTNNGIALAEVYEF